MPIDVSNLKILADAGDSNAAFAIFDAYEDVKTDTDAAWDVALHYLTLASDAENPDALLAMGRLLITGNKIDKDVDKGMTLLRRAKELGNRDVDDVANELDIALDIALDTTDRDHDYDNVTADGDGDDADANDMDNQTGIDQLDTPSDEDHSPPTPKPEKDDTKKTKQTDLGTPDDPLTADQLIRMIKTKLSQLEKSEAMSASHHFDILKITIDDSENTKVLQ
ncbi:tetratricopeptide repeat protein, partial [Candidatus Puniceispirillum sp.]|uniref:tetratricopeptide repeat protein n=1 Tax=Candidatus Puniceispirillum sp. TaxID=2026719 RepID=UPI003F695A59